MNATSYQRGHRIEYIGGRWVYADDQTTSAVERPCVRCGRIPTPDGHDACLGRIEATASACCGHGVEEPYVMGIRR